MKNPFKRSKPYRDEQQRLLEFVSDLDPTTSEYETVLARIDKLDRILNRTTELKKTVIPALGTGGAVVGIYALQQFAGVIVPKALDSLAARSEKKQPQELE